MIFTTIATHAPIIPTKMLSDPEELERQLMQSTIPFTSDFIVDVDQLISPHIALVPFQPMDLMARRNTFELASPCTLDVAPVAAAAATPERLDSPETETYEVELRKNVYGLGITVAGYVCEEEDLSGIFVKSIIEGSAAELSGTIQVNDRIVAVDGKTLSGVTNHQAVELLRNTDICVRLTLERFLRGRKFEHLQVALTEAKENKSLSLPPSPSIATLTWVILCFVFLAIPLFCLSLSLYYFSLRLRTAECLRLHSIFCLFASFLGGTKIGCRLSSNGEL